MDPLLFHATLYVCLALCLAGTAWRISAWFRSRVGRDIGAAKPSERMLATLRGIGAALFGRRALRVVGALVLDGLLQRRLLAQETLRWGGHLLAFVGFLYLLLGHALAPLVTAKLFSGYQATLNPWLFLRDLGGAMVMLGVALLLFGRRRRVAPFAPPARRADKAFVLLLGVVLVSGFLLQAHKIASPRAFYRMTQTFLGTRNPADLEPLRALWARDFGTAFADLEVPRLSGLTEQGQKMHAEACAVCHAQASSAFVSFPLARLLASLADALDWMRAEAWLLHIHLFACFLGLAGLPFTRFFHALSAPFALLLNAAASAEASPPGLLALRRALALDACVRCGICDLHCSVAPIARYLGNAELLPSHKLRNTGDIALDRLRARRADVLRIADGAFLCTDCGRCTERCPIGLDLADLWQAGRADLSAIGLHAPARWVRSRTAHDWAQALELHAGTRDFFTADATYAPLSADRRRFSRCVQCQTCTNVCPVVAHSVEPQRDADLTPQKVMNLLRLGMGDLALGSRMVWDCASCYQCQENCPEGVRVTDILLELRSLAVQRLGALRAAEKPS